MVVAIMAVVLLLFAGLAIDATMTATSQSQMRYRAEFAALAALKKYHEEPGGYLAKLEAARQRAEEMAGLNLSIGTAFEENPGQGQGIGTSHSTSPTPHTGVITPGIWHRQEPADCTGLPSPCPCDGGVWKGACFQEIDLDDPGQQNLVPTAFKADVYTRTASPIKRIFGNLVGQSTIELSASATASVVPYHGVVLLDISRSAHRETHVPFETTGGMYETVIIGATESAWQITSHSCPPDNSNPCLVPGICTLGGGWGSPGGLYNAIYNYSAPAILNSPRPGSPLQPPTKHYRNDYQCFSSTYSEDGGSSQTVHYLVDTWRGTDSSGNTYYGPEPLSTLLHGINKLYDHLNKYPARGDLLGMVAFDKSAKIDIRTFPLEPVGAADFQKAMLITDIDNEDAASRKQRYEDHMFFPRVEGYTNYPQALRVAEEMLLSAPDSESAENFVLLISDGLTNCSELGACSYDEASYLNSVSESLNIILNDYVENQIKFHMVIAGELTKPHTMLSSSQTDPSQCMTEEEARLSNPPLNFTDSEANAEDFAEATRRNQFTSGVGFYYDPSRFYDAVRATDGLWLPLRPCCKVGGVCTDVQNDLQAVCAAASPGTIPGRPEQPLPAIHPDHTDPDGRLTCDAEGRSRRVQLEDYVNKIFERNPYVLVE